MKAIELYNELEPTFKLIVQGYNLFDKYQTNKHRKIVTSFHRNILDGNESEKRIKYEQENIKANQEDYFTLLKFAIEDEEDEKVDIYTNVYKYIRDNQSIEKDEKRKILKIAKELSYSTIELMPKIFVLSKFSNLEENLETYLSNLANNPKFLYETNLFIQYGLFKDIKAFDNKKVEITELFKEISTIFFKEDTLSPDYLGLKQKEKTANIVLLSDLGNIDMSKENMLKYLLKRAKINVLPHINFTTKPNGRILNLICLFDKEPLSEQTITILKNNLTEAPSFNITKVTFYENIIDPIPDIGNRLIYIDLNDKDSIDNFINSFEIE